MSAHADIKYSAHVPAGGIDDLTPVQAGQYLVSSHHMSMRSHL
jgi:hypothetical protein